MAASNPKVSNIAINNIAGLMTNIVLTIMASRVVIAEDPNFNGGQLQGLQGYYIDTNPPQEVTPIMPGGLAPPNASPANLQIWLPNTDGQLGPNFEPIIFGGSEAGRVHGGQGYVVGGTGMVILQLRTNSINAGGVLLYEWA